MAHMRNLNLGEGLEIAVKVNENSVSILCYDFSALVKNSFVQGRYKKIKNKIK